MLPLRLHLIPLAVRLATVKEKGWGERARTQKTNESGPSLLDKDHRGSSEPCRVIGGGRDVPIFARSIKWWCILFDSVVEAEAYLVFAVLIVPFQLKVRPHIEPNKVTVEGVGVSGKGIPASIPAEFTIDTNQAGYGDLDINVKYSSSERGRRGTPKQRKITTQEKEGWDSEKVEEELRSIEKDPEQMFLQHTDVSGIYRIQDIQLEHVKDKITAYEGPDGYPRKVKLTDNGDSTFKASYIPDDCGRYKVSVKYGGKEVPHSPFQVQAVATGSADKCKITEGIQQTLTSGEEYCITVNTKNAGYGAVTCRIRSTSGRLEPPLNENDKSLITLGHSCWDGRGSILAGFTGVGFPVQGRQSGSSSCTAAIRNGLIFACLAALLHVEYDRPVSWDNLQRNFLGDANNCCFTSCILSSIILGRHQYVDPPSFPLSPASSPSSKWRPWLVVYANQIYSDTPSDIVRKNRSLSTDAQ
uniref:Uncharacterized protein n=1 Tax=Timema tahoe TaxID=61484 RepID=A0A7R9NUT7_9NEOP|nr:unnamed protein product [Timema tahoe]